MYDEGRNLVTGLPDEVEISAKQRRNKNAIKEPVDTEVKQ